MLRTDMYQNRGLEVSRRLIEKSFFLSEIIKRTESSLFFIVITL